MVSCDRWGIEDGYEDAFGRRRPLVPEVRERLRAAMSLPDEEAEPPIRFLRPDTRRLQRPATVVLEGGGERRVEGELPLDLPWGYHRLCEDGGEPVELVVSPRQCRAPARQWGLALSLYALRSAASWGIGDLADLERLGGFARRDLGASLLLVNPLGAALPLARQEPSPYFASSRCFKSPLLLSIEHVDGAAGADIAALAEAGRRLSDAPLIDRSAIWALKREALERVYAVAPGGEALDAWRRSQGEPLERYARFCALAEHFQSGRRGFPAEYRHPASPAVATFAADHADRVRVHAWLQWQLDRQLARAAAATTLVQDLPIGFDGDGADGWAYQDCLADGVAIGAPPDPFNEAGQEWGLPPFIPWKLRAAGYRPFIETLRACFAPGGGLRIDHVMGFFRLFWIPRGVEPTLGAYVRYPSEDLLDLLALECHRAGAFVVGEDLGTVPPGVREVLASRNILSYRLLWFEPAPTTAWPELAMAAVTTHDLPTIAGLWSGADVEDQRRWGQPASDQRELAARLCAQGGIGADASEIDAVRAAHRALAKAPCRLALASLEDLLLERRRPNLPGQSDRPNWCLPLATRLEQIEENALVREVAAILAAR